MANQTIYPYGTGGQLPSSIGIINDLTTGGADKALSAEMGKHLGPIDDLITTATEVIRPTYTTGYKLGNYQWAIGEIRTQEPKSNSTGKWAKMAVLAGDTANVWGCVGSADYLWALCDTSNKVVALGVKGYGSDWITVTEADPAVVNVTVDGWLYLSTVTTAAYGCKVMREHPALQIADSTHDGIMSKEQAAQLESVSAEDGDLTILNSYIVDSADVFNAEFVTGKYYRNFGIVNYIGQSYQGGDITDDSDYACVKVTVKAGDIVTIWCSVTNTGIPYVICDSNNIIKVCSPKSTNSTPYTYTRENPAVLNMTYDGYIYIDALTSAAYGCIVTTPKRAFRNATTEEDGLMPKEIMALFGGDSMSDDQTSLKLKTFAFIGDSFSAGGYWQSTMCNDLGALLSSNKAVSGGAWYGTDSLSAYYQAGKLIETGSQYDYILCVLGTNDIAHWSTYTLGDIVNSETIGTASGNVNPNGSITGGIQATLIRLKNAFPNAIIKIGYTPAGYIHDAFNQIANVEALCDRLKELSHIYGVGYIETRDCGICKWMEADLHAYTGTTSGGEWSSTGHPSGAGQTRIGHYMARIMMSNL